MGDTHCLGISSSPPPWGRAAHSIATWAKTTTGTGSLLQPDLVCPKAWTERVPLGWQLSGPLPQSVPRSGGGVSLGGMVLGTTGTPRFRPAQFPRRASLLPWSQHPGPWPLGAQLRLPVSLLGGCLAPPPVLAPKPQSAPWHLPQPLVVKGADRRPRAQALIWGGGCQAHPLRKEEAAYPFTVIAGTARCPSLSPRPLCRPQPAPSSSSPLPGPRTRHSDLPLLPHSPSSTCPAAWSPLAGQEDRPARLP